MGDRLQFTAPNRELGVANRDLGTIEQIGRDGQITVRMDNGKPVTFDPTRCGTSTMATPSLAIAPRGSLRARTSEHRHQCSPGTHQHPLRICFGIARFAGRADFYQCRFFTLIEPQSSGHKEFSAGFRDRNGNLTRLRIPV